MTVLSLLWELPQLERLSLYWDGALAITWTKHHEMFYRICCDKTSMKLHPLFPIFPLEYFGVYWFVFHFHTDVISIYYKVYFSDSLIHNALSQIQKEEDNVMLITGIYYRNLWVMFILLMAQCKTAVTPLLTHWSYCSLTLSHRYLALVYLPRCWYQ